MTPLPTGAAGKMHSISTAWKRLWTLLLLVFLCGCATSGTQTTGELAYPSPLGALSRIERRAADDCILKTVASVEILTLRERTVMKAVLLAGKPDSLRIESLPIIGPPDFLLSVYRNTLKVHYPLQRKIHIGPSTDQNLLRFLPVPIPISDFVRILMGIRPEIKGQQVLLKAFPEGDLYRIHVLAGGQLRQTLWIDPRQDRLRRVEVFGALDDTLYTADFDRFPNFRSGTIPERIALTVNAYGGVKISIRYHEPELTTEPPTSDLFDIGSPEGADIVPME